MHLIPLELEYYRNFDVMVKWNVLYYSMLQLDSKQNLMCVLIFQMSKIYDKFFSVRRYWISIYLFRILLTYQNLVK